MKVSIISDLHIDFWIKPDKQGEDLANLINKFIDDTLKPESADILIIAGDNSHYNNQNRIFLEELVKRNIYKKIFVTFGNHDMYLVSRKQKDKYKKSWNKVQELKEICNEIPTVEFLDGDIFEIDGLKIGGCGMWYDGSYAKKIFGMNDYDILKLWSRTMNDANLIEGETIVQELFNPQMYGSGHKIYTFHPFEFFEKEKEKMLSIVEKVDIFVSHVGPVVPNNLKPGFQNAVTGFYYFDGEHHLKNEKAPKLWVYGHTHDRYHFNVNNTELICNPLGYKNENNNHHIITVEVE